MTSLIFDKIIRPTPAATWIDSDEVLNVHWPEYDRICRAELLFLCKVLATVHGHSTEDERYACVRYFRVYGIKCTIRSISTGSIWKIKYQSELHKFSHLWMRACRGTLVKVEGTQVVTTTLINCPPIKFFPLDKFEDFYGKSAKEMLFRDNNFSTPTIYEAREKIDGSFITIYYDGTQVTANTLGSFGESCMQPGKQCFQTRALSYLTEEIREYIQKNRITLVCELVTPDNRIVSRYKREGLCLLYLLTKEHKIADSVLTDTIYSELFEGHSGWWRPRSYQVKSMNDIHNLMDEIKELMPDVGTPEGFVLYCNNIPIGKIKTEEYKHMHKGVVMNVGSDQDLCIIDKLFYLADPNLQNYCLEYDIRYEYLNKLEQKHLDLRDQIIALNESWDSTPVEEQTKALRANLIKKHIKEHWLQSYFFKHEIKSNVIPEELIRDYFSSTTNSGKTNLELIHAKDGPLAKISTPSTEVVKSVSDEVKAPAISKPVKFVGKKMAACFDFDGTLVDIDVAAMGKHEKKFVNEIMVSIWDRKASFQYATPNPKVWALLKGYLQIDVPTFIVTGRKTPVEHKLYNYIQSQSDSILNVNLITLPHNAIRYNNRGLRMLVPNVCVAKKFVYTVLSQKYKCLVYEDDTKVLAEVKTLGCAGIQVVDGKLDYPEDKENPSTHVVALCGPPGSGKTTILKSVRQKLEYNNVSVDYVSADEEYHTRSFNTKLIQALQKKPRILLVDMCFSCDSNMETIVELGRPFTIFTHMPVKNGEIHPFYPHWCLNNVLNREGHEVLDNTDYERCKKTVVSKVGYAERTLYSYTLLYPNLYDEIDEYMSILPPEWKMKRPTDESEGALRHTYWPIPNEEPLANKIWRPYKREARPLNDVWCRSECANFALDIDVVLPRSERTANILTERIVRTIVSIPKKRSYPGFYFGLGVSEHIMSSLPQVETVPGQVRPFVSHVTVDVIDPLGPQRTELGSILTLKSKNLYTDSNKSLLALEIQDFGLVEYPHISLCWEGKPVDCRRVLESGKNIIVSEMEVEIPACALYLV